MNTVKVRGLTLVRCLPHEATHNGNGDLITRMVPVGNLFAIGTELSRNSTHWDSEGVSCWSFGDRHDDEEIIEEFSAYKILDENPKDPFDMKENSWKVKATEENFRDVYKWIESKGFQFSYPNSALKGISEEFGDSVKEIGFLYQTDTGNRPCLLYTTTPDTYGITEIVVETITSVNYNVKWPTILTPKQKEIAKLESEKALIESKLADLRNS